MVIPEGYLPVVRAERPGRVLGYLRCGGRVRGFTYVVPLITKQLIARWRMPNEPPRMVTITKITFDVREYGQEQFLIASSGIHLKTLKQLRDFVLELTYLTMLSED